MKRFYFLRHIDVNGFSGTGVVAEGVIFDWGAGSFTWLTPKKTVTTFWNMADIDFMHGKGGKTEIIFEDDDRFADCVAQAQVKKQQRRIEERLEEERKEKRREQARKKREEKKNAAVKASKEATPSSTESTPQVQEGLQKKE